MNETYALHIGDEVQQIRIADGAMTVQQGEPPRANVALYTEVPVYLGLLLGQLDLDAALAGGLIGVTGDLDALRRFLTICQVPAVAQPV